MITKDYDAQAQCEMFDDYLHQSAGIEDRTLHGRGYSYAECEWEAFQSGWNAAKQYFTVTGAAL